MANINITQIRMKRGNTAAASTYTGPLGELLVDTGLKTIRVQDGVTPGGMATLATNVQLQALGTYANATFGTSSYGNANVALYLSTSSIIGNINANVIAANAAITSLTSNAATQATLIDAINANVTAANAAITSLTSNAAIQASILDTLTGNAASQSTLLDTLTSNAATQATSLTTLLSNAVTQQTSLTDLVANAAIQAQAIANAAGTYGNANVAVYLSSQNITSANIGGSQTYANTQVNTISANLGAYQTYGNLTFSTVANAASQSADITTLYANAAVQSANIATLFSNAATQSGSIATLQTQVYANANVAAYLPTYTGDIAANIVKNGYTWRFGTNGTTQFPGSQILAPAGESITMQSDQYSQLMWENANVTVAPNMAINSNFYVAQNNATLDIGYRDGSSTQLIKTWLWSVDGSLTLPAGGTITEGGGISGAIRLTPAGGANSNQALVIYPTAGAPEGDHIHLTAGGGSTELYLGNDYHYVKLVDGGNIELRATTANLSPQASWTFDTAGNIDARQALAIKVPNGVPSNVAVINSTTGSWEANPNLSLATTGGSGTGLTVNVADTGGYASTIEIATAGTGYTNGDLITVTSGTSNATFTIVIGGRNSWQFGGTGNLTLPETGYLRVGSGIVAGFISSPAPIISGFSSISAVNLGASGNVLAGGQVIANGVIESGAGFSTGGYLSVDGSADLHNTTVTGNISATGNINASQYNFANGVNILSTVAGTYGNANVAEYLPTYTGNIAGNIVKSGYTWTFSNTGTTTFPTGVRLSNARGANTVNFTTDIDKSFQIETQTSTTSRLWSFGTDGNLTLPQFANINFSNGVNILSTVGAGSYGNANVASYLLNFDGDIEFTSSTAKIGNVDVITVGDHIQSPAYRFSNGVSILSGVVSKTTGSWTVTVGTNTYSFTVPTSGTYQLWVNCNIPNGILAYNATATVTNSNVPVVGQQFAWVYNGGGTPVDFVSIPNQFTGTANTIVRSNTAPSATTNRFDFGINNTSGGNVTVSYGWIQIS
jgi:hypothetical protein